MTTSKLERLKDLLTRKDPLLRWGTKFVDVEECSEPYQRAYQNAWTAITYGNIVNLQESIKSMEKHAGTCPGPERFLDVCSLKHEMSLRERKRTFYYMGLLAHAGICGHKNLVIELLKKARPDMGDCLSGLPLTQILVYALHHNCPEVISSEILQLIIRADFNINVISFMSERSGAKWCSPVELAIKVKRIDIVQQLVTAGANPIHPSLNGTSGVLQLLDEYYEFGTNKYISWLLHQYYKPQEISSFIETVVRLDIFNDSGMKMFNEVGRHPAHALFTCGSEEMIRKLLDHHQNMKVNVKDKSGRTALQIATENGDLESVKILLKFYRLDLNLSSGTEGHELTDQRENVQVVKTENAEQVSNNATNDVELKMADLDMGDKAQSEEKRIKEERTKIIKEDIDEDLKKTTLAAARSGDVKILRCLLEDSIQNVVAIVNQAVEEGLTSLFEVLREYNFIDELLTSDNSLVHIAARTGNARLFKVFFPLQWTSGTRTSAGPRRKMFSALALKDDSEKTPLELAIDCNHISILKTLQERIIERESIPGAQQNKEKNAWNIFWKKWGPKLFIYGCAHGTVAILKFLMEMEQEYGGSSGSRFKEAKDDLETPLSAAAKNGNDDILLYLLDICRIPIPEYSQRSPLLLAAENGHAACISILLKKGADVTQKNEFGLNCLMIATERKHSCAVMAILADKQAFKALRCRKKTVTPMRMLIQHLPRPAEWILNRCVLEKFEQKQSSANEDTDGPASDMGLISEFEFLEDFKPSEPHSNIKTVQMNPDNDDKTVQKNSDKDDPDIGDSDFNPQRKEVDWRPMKYRFSDHTIKLMAKYNCEELLNHVLVEALIEYRWWRIGFPILLLSFSFHLSFLILLTAFALQLPTAGPACAIGMLNNTSNASGAIDLLNSVLYTTLDDISCEESGVSDDQRSFLISLAVIVILYCGFYLLLEVFQILKRGPRKYLSDPQNYFQVVTYCTVIVFVFPLGHTCWCYPSWKWQVGALALFLAWINNLVLLKEIPQIGKPIAMLFNVYVNFLKLIYLPVLLALTFAFPFYMLFVATLQEGVNEMMVTLYSTPWDAMWNVIIQTADGPDAQFFSAPLSHQIMTYTLFIIFIAAVPILFNNFLTGLAVGETEEERKKAKLSLVKAKVDYVFESEDSILFFRRCFGGRDPKLDIDASEVELLKSQNALYLEELKLEGDLQNSFKKLQRELAGTTKSSDAKFKQVSCAIKELNENTRSLDAKFKQVFCAMEELKEELKEGANRR